MGNRADKGGLVTIFGAMIAVALAWDLYEHLMIKPVALPILLFEVVEVFLLVCIAASCIFVVDGVRVGEMAAAAATLIVLLLVGELYLGDKPATSWTLLLQLLEVVLVLVIVAFVMLLHGIGRMFSDDDV